MIDSEVTVLGSHRDFNRFQGHTAEEFAARLRTILSRALIREFERHWSAGKRDLRREISLDTVATNLESSCVIRSSRGHTTANEPKLQLSAADWFPYHAIDIP